MIFSIQKAMNVLATISNEKNNPLPSVVLQFPKIERKFANHNRARGRA